MAGPFDPQSTAPRPGVAGMRPSSAPVGVQAPHPGFVDARPAAQVLKTPAPGYDYSNHPEFAAFLKATQPAPNPAPTSARAPESGSAPTGGGFLSVPPSPPLPTIGVPGGGQLPRPGVRYPASQSFQFPAGYGHGYIEKDGMREYSYNTPEQRDASEASAAAHRERQWDTERHGMIRDTHEAINALLNGANGRYGDLAPEERAHALAAMSSQLGGLMGTDAQAHADAYQHGNDPAYRQAAIAHLQAQAESEKARGRQFDAEADAANHPERQVDLMRSLLMDPQLGPRYLALKGVSPVEQGSLPPILPPGKPGEPSVHAGNLDSVLGQQGNQTLQRLLAEKDMSLLERTRRAALLPGMNDTSHPTHQAYQAWLRQEYTDPSRWREDTYVPPDPDRQLPYLGRLTGLANAGWQSIFGDHTAGTGFGWRQNYEDRTALRDLLARLNLGDPTIPQRGGE